MARNQLSKAAATLGRKGGKIGGKIGGKSRSDAKVAAVRANGRKGGRPRKVSTINTDTNGITE